MSDLKPLLDKALDAVRKDLTHISFDVAKGKLKPGPAKDLVAYVKLLSDALEQEKKEEDQEEDAIAKLTDEELRAKAKELLK